MPDEKRCRRKKNGHSPPLTDSGRGVTPLNLEFLDPIFRIAFQ